MKIFSASGQTGRPKRSTALNCLLMNQFATPGLGSLMGGRIFAGLVQLGLAILGFVMVLLWMVDKFAAAYHDIDSGTEESAHHPWLGLAGFGIFAAAWILAWFTSISLLRNASKAGPEPELEQRPIPPIIEPPKL